MNAQVETMKLASSGKHRSRETRDRISRARKERGWKYAGSPPANPSIGYKARIGGDSCIWAACSVCGTPRWVRAKRGGIPAHDICVVCNNRLPAKLEASRIRESGKTHSPERVEKNRIAHLGQVVSAEERRQRSLLWSDPEWRRWTMRRQRARVCPNKPERQLQQLLDGLYPGEWRFVGDGSFLLANLNPDFVNINGKKIIIEMFGDYWHRGQNPGDRAVVFASFGYHTLIVWEKELAETRTLTAKLRRFVNG